MYPFIGVTHFGMIYSNVGPPIEEGCCLRVKVTSKVCVDSDVDDIVILVTFLRFC